MKLRFLLLLWLAATLISVISACSTVGDTSLVSKDTVNPSTQPTMQTEKRVFTGKMDYAKYDSIDALFTKADYVIEGKIISARVEWMSHIINSTSTEKNDPKLNPGGEKDNNTQLTTIFTVEIIDNFRGGANRTFEVMQLGGETDTAIYRYDGAPTIVKGEIYVMFLKKSRIRDNASWLLNDAQSIYHVEGDVLTKPSKDAFDLSLSDLAKRAGRK